MPLELRLEPVTKQNVVAACRLKVRPDQEDLVAPVAWSLALAYTMPDIAWPRLVYVGDRLAGFVLAAFAPHQENPLYHSFLLRLNVDAEHQGRGAGRFAVEAVCQEARLRGNHRLTVSYLPGQHGPDGFYRRLDFQPTGAYLQNEVVAERSLS
jgi:diamine N-acetyltransferase